MKIDEAVNVINSTMTVRAKVDGDYLNVFSKDMISDNWFLKLNTKAINWDTVLKHWGGLTEVAPEDLARAMDVIQRLLDTPVKERFPEKKYRLVVKRETSFHPKYVSNIITGFDELVFDLSEDEKEARIFSEKELNQIKEREPSLAPAIDAMKEPAEDKDE